MERKFNGRLTLRGLVVSKVQRFQDDILRYRLTSNLTPEWLYNRIKRLMIPGNYVSCETCGMAMTFEGITLDHKVPRSLHKNYKGNVHNTDNLELICPTCNSMKGQRTLDEFLEELKTKNECILQLSHKHLRKEEIISPLYPKIGLGLELFGDRSAKNYGRPASTKFRKQRIHDVHRPVPRPKRRKHVGVQNVSSPNDSHSQTKLQAMGRTSTVNMGKTSSSNPTISVNP